MSRQKFDQFSKQCLAEMLEPDGQVNLNYEIQGVSRYADVYFTPTSTPLDERAHLGLLSQMTTGPCLLEPFRNQPTRAEIRHCVLKLLALQSELLRQAKQKKHALPEKRLPQLWILGSSASDNLLNFFEAKPKMSEWGEGIYFLNPWARTAIVAIDRLPITRETLWLRVLGKGATQQQAIEEITALKKEDDLRNRVLELLFIWHIHVEAQQRLTTDDKELLMNLRLAYQQYKDEILQEGVKDGVQQGRSATQRVFVKNWLRSRFGRLDKTLSQVVEPLVKLSPEKASRFLMQSSREELLAKFAQK